LIYTRVRDLNVDGYHWHYVPGATLGVIPTNNGETVVFAAAARDRFMGDLRRDLPAGFHAIVRETSPELAAALGAAPLSPYRAFAGLPGFLRPAWGPGWALVGDAGYFKDPITAHGITDALRDAELLAHAIVRGTDAALAEYQALRDQLSVSLFAITDEIASFAWDLPRVQALHKSLSEEMNREVSLLTAA
jgi:flavin-dependent dehydrogenase